MKRFAKVKTNGNMVSRGLVIVFLALSIKCSYAQVLPNQIPNLITWLSADSLVTYNASFFVSDWGDINGNYDCSQSNPPQQPVFIPSETLLNGKPSIHFSSANNTRLNFAATVIPMHPFSVFIVSRQDAPADQAILSSLSSGSGAFFKYQSTGTQIRFFSYQVLYDNNITSFQDANFTIYSFINQSADSLVSGNVYLNIDQQTQPAVSMQLSPAPIDGNLTIGSLAGPATVIPLDGNIAEIIIYDSALTAAEVNDVEMYLRNKYAPPINLGADSVIVSNLCDTTLDAGARFVSYRWYRTDDTTTLSTAQTLLVTRRGSYVIEVTDVFGFTSSDTINVDYPINQLPLFNMLCLNDSLLWNTNLSPSNHTFLWNTSDTTSSIFIHFAGQYWVTITDSFTCSKTSDTITVAIDSFSVTASLNPYDSLCAGNSVALASGASQAQTYLWSDNSTGPSLAVFTNGNYWVTVTDTNGCVLHDTTTVTIIGYAPIVNFTAPTVCRGDTTFFTDLSDTAVSAWHWNFDEPVSGPDNFSALQNPYHIYADSGTYMVILSDTTGIGCYNDTAIAVVVKPSPVAFFTHPSIACTDSALQFTNTSDTAGLHPVWLWNFGDPGSAPFDTSSQISPSHTYDSVGNYIVSLTVTLPGNGCSAVYTNLITVNQAVVPSFSYFNSCIGQVTNFFASGSGATLYWDFGDNVQASGSTVNHQYPYVDTFTCTLTAITMQGCTNSVAMPVFIHDVPVAYFSTSSACINVPYQLMDSSYIPADSITQWLWSFPDFATSTQQNPYYTFTDTLLHSITLIATSNYGCKDTVTRIVKVHPLPTASFTSDFTYGDAPLDVDFTNHSLGASTFAWDFGDTSGTSTLTNPSYTFTALGTYPVTLIANTLYGCTDTTVKYIYVVDPYMDLAVTSVSKTTGANSMSITAGISNLGNIEVSKFRISAWLENSLPVFEDWNGSLLPHSTLVPDYNFAAQFEIPQITPPSFLCVEITEVNNRQDDNAANNIKCINLGEDFVIVDPYPNPASQIINLQVIVTRKDVLTISVYDAAGKLIKEVFNGQTTTGLNKFIFDTSSLAHGTYFCKYTFNAKTIVKPLTHISKKK